MTYSQTLKFPGLQPFLWTQFLGAFNDNVFKIVVSFLAMEALGGVDGVALVGAVFILPFLLFSGYAGHLADRYSKRAVLVWMKWLEVAAMALAVPALLTGHLGLLLTVLFLMAAQSTFFSPAKFGILPELLPIRELSRANGLLEMSTFVAIIAGTSIGGLVFAAWRDTPVVIGGVQLLLAALGLWTSTRIPHLAPVSSGRAMSVAPWTEILVGLRELLRDRTLWMTAVGTAFFWFLGALLQLALLPYATTTLGANEAAATQLYAALAIGIGAGSLMAGRLSGNHIEFGLVPLGSLGMAVFSLALAAASPSYWWSAVALMALGFSGGFFIVPLKALLQHRPAPDQRGRILATGNVLQTVGILLASVVLWVFGTRLAWPIPSIFAAAGAFTFVAGIYALLTLPAFFIRFTLWMLTHTVYRITVVGQQHVPHDGPALLICNHVSMIDGALVGASVQRFVRFLMHGPYFRLPGIHFVMSRLHAIPITAGDKADVDRAIARARQELLDGHIVCIFVEGAVSRTGNLLPFRPGFQRILEGIDVPVIPVYLDRVWGSVFSFKRGKFFWKRPERLPYPVTVAYGAPLPSTLGLQDARLAISELGTEALRHRLSPTSQLHTAFIRTAREHWSRPAVADSTGQRLTYGRLLTATLLLGRVIRARTTGQTRVGLLLPASVGGAVANIATLMAGRVPVNLNYTTGADAMATAKAAASISTVITSRQFVDHAGFTATADMVYLEDLHASITERRRLFGLLRARLTPQRLLRASVGDPHWMATSPATIVVSSGRTGVPKGVVLTHGSLLSNVESLAQVFHMQEDDCVVGVLPFFHAFGLTGTLWFPLLQGCAVAYHQNPLDAKIVGELAERVRGSMLVCTPTFAHSCLQRCTPEQFAHLRYAIVGAEKLPAAVATAFVETFGLGLLEGYGCTEMSPVVAANVPDVQVAGRTQVGTKPGSVGHPIPGVAAKVVDPHTGDGPLINRDGLLLVKGPNMMSGYLNDAARTSAVMRDGWYVTGDIARIDEDGFIFITDALQSGTR